MILEVWPIRAQFRPAERVGLWVSVSGAEPGTLSFALRVLSESNEIHRASHRIPVRFDGSGTVQVSIPEVALPPAGDLPAGYAVEVAISSADTVVRATTAFDVVGHWSLAPRYGFFSDFGPEETEEEAGRRADLLLRLHINVVQFYDWMASHHTFFSTAEEFTDPLGRVLSHVVVRRKVDLAHDRGIAALAYGALYGAEWDFSSQHTDWLLYDGSRQPLILADIFYLQDFSQDSGWREWILDQYREALANMGFDGIHIDQYGFPKQALSKTTGEWRDVDVGEEFPRFVEEAASTLRDVRPDGGSIFNCVNAWPLEAMARVGADAATYIEVWEPNSTYRDLYDLVRRARRLRPDKQVILAAYLRPFHPGDGRTSGAMNTFRLASAAVTASGGFHLVSGEGDGLLTEAYYPNYGRLAGDEWEVVRRYSDFAVRNMALLHDGVGPDIAWTHVGPANEAILLDHPELGSYGAGARLDSLWVTGRDAAGLTSLNLVNLRGLKSDEWNVDHPEPPDPLEQVEVRVRVTGNVDGVWWDTPDDDVGHARLIPFEVTDTKDGLVLGFRVPKVDFWSLIWWRRQGAVS